MSLSGVYASMAEIVRALRLNMPVHIQLFDPVSNQEISFDRENLLALLVVDAPNLLLDSQWVAAMYVECGRAQRAAARSAAHAERSFVRWKAETSAAARAGKKLTVAEAEEAYRTHPEYEQKASAQTYWQNLADLFEDAKQGFSLKSRMIEMNARMLAGDLTARRAESNASELVELEQRARAGTASTAAAVPQQTTAARSPRGLG